MRRLDAILSESRKSVSSKSKLGKTEKSTARRTCTAERKTSTEAENEQASSRSSTTDGTGINITKITLIAATGSERSLHSFNSLPAKPVVVVPGLEDAGTIAVALMASPW